MRLPDDSQRLLITGKTGSGKTNGGLWQLEKRSITRRPWTIVDFKGDKIIARIPRLEEIDIRHAPPKHAGLYVVRPLPGDDDQITEYLWKVWEQERHGLFVDEAYMLGRFNKAYNSILTQGRSKEVPVIALSQRPSWLSPFQMSESEFFQVFHIRRPEDRERLEEWIPGLPLTKHDYHSFYYDDEREELTHLAPVPPPDEILDRFDRRLPRRPRPFRNFLSVPEHKRRMTA